MRVIYSGFDFGLIRCDSYDIEAVYDPTGKDLCFHRIHLTILGVLNPYFTSSGKDTENIPAGAYKVRGNDIGTALDVLKDQLLTPRQDLEIFVGKGITGNEVQVIDCPGTYTDGQPATQDPEGGPTPGRFRIYEICGDKSAKFSWSVVFAVTQCARYVLSNRWTSQAHTDSEGMTTRITRGRAMFRADYLYDESLTADDFRKWLVIPCPPLLRRHSVDCTVASDNTQIDYSITDRQVGWGVGQFNAPNNPDGSWPAVRWGVTRIEGSVTTGYEIPSNEKFGFSGLSLALATAAGGITARGAEYYRALARTGETVANMVLFGKGRAPVAKAICRVYCQPGITDKQALVNIATSVISDRLRPAGVLLNSLDPVALSGAVSPLTGFSVTQDFGSENAPYVQVHASFLCLNVTALTSLIFPAYSTQLQNYNTSFIISYSATDVRTFSSLSSTPTLPNSNNTRGNWIGELFVAALNSDACEVPPAAGPVGKSATVNGVYLGETGYGINVVEEPDKIK